LPASRGWSGLAVAITIGARDVTNTTAHAAARGAAWMISTSLAARAVGLLGTLIMTRFLAPEVMGEVTAAWIVTTTTGWLATWGFGTYAVVKGRGEAALEVTWHATVAYAVVGAVGLGSLLWFAPAIASLIDAPAAASYVPGLVLATIIRRAGATPERVLTRSLRFRPVAVASGVGEIVYTLSAIVLAASGWGGDAVVVGNIVQSTVVTSMLIRAAGWREWATPTPLRWARFKDMLRFGVPLCIQGVAHNGAKFWGGLLVTRLFGTSATGVYNLAYSLADLPATYVGEQLGLVLMPSIADMPPERRPRALERATALLSLLIFPIAIGLGLVAEPLVATVLPTPWQGVAPVLTVLAALSVFRPVTWVINGYMEAQARTTGIMVLEVAQVALALAGIWAMSSLGLTWSASAVGIALALTAIAGVRLVATDGVSTARLARGFLGPLGACGVMVAAVLALRPQLENVVPPWLQLAIEIAFGAVVYGIAGFALCRATARDLIGLVRGILDRRGDRA
jgi:lipopolysaccharide exporter